MQKTFIISFQKSGTYLISEILENLGYNKTLIHINKFLNNIHQRYDEQKINEGRTNFKNFNFESSPEKVINDLNDSQFAVGHIFFSKRAKEILKNHKKILSKRNIKTSLISMMKFLEESLRVEEIDKNTWYPIKDQKEKFFYFLKLRGSGFINTCYKILPWIYEDLLIIKFENIIDPEKDTNEVKRVSDYLNITSKDYKKILKRSFEKKTLTKSLKRTDLYDYWSQPSENLFNSIGGNEINNKLGYD